MLENILNHLVFTLSLLFTAHRTHKYKSSFPIQEANTDPQRIFKITIT